MSKSTKSVERDEQAEQALYEREQQVRRNLDEVYTILSGICPKCRNTRYISVKGMDVPCKCMARAGVDKALQGVRQYNDIGFTPLAKHLRSKSNLVITCNNLREDQMGIGESTDLVKTHLRAAILALGDKDFTFTQVALGTTLDTMFKGTDEEKAMLRKGDLIMVVADSGFLYTAMCSHVSSLLTARSASNKDTDNTIAATANTRIPTWIVLPSGQTVAKWLESSSPAVKDSEVFKSFVGYLNDNVEVITLDGEDTLARVQQCSAECITPLKKPLSEKTTANIAALPW